MRPPFRTTYWQNYPPPFYPGSSGQYPVPGWGVRPVMAGPARLGVGQEEPPPPQQPPPDVRAAIDAALIKAYAFVGLVFASGVAVGYYASKRRRLR